MRTIAEVLRWRARQHPERVALWHEGRATTYAELDHRANRVAHALHGARVRPGDRVAILDVGHDRVFETMFGIAKAGAVYTPVNWRLAPPEIEAVLADAGALALFAGDDFANAVEAVRGALPKLRTVVAYGSGREGWVPWERFLASGADGDPQRDGDESETAWQLYTSGTTGLPKGAELTGANLVGAMCVNGVMGNDLAGDTAALICMPLYHVGGSGYALSAFYHGARLVVTRQADPAEILELLETQGITHAFFVPALLQSILRQPGCGARDLSRLRSLLYGASPIPEDLLKEAMATFRCGFMQGYGLTETCGAVTLLPEREHVPGSPRLRSCGLPIFGHRIRVLDAEGRECPPGQVGELAIRGPAVMKGYWNRPDASDEVLRDGWFRSGDAGFADEDGYLYIHDRVKDMIVSGGENVYPAEVESALYAHPGVADVAVIGVPDERYGEAVKAVVVRAPGTAVDEAELVEFCRERIASYKKPRSVDFVDELPRNPTGKILKRELRERYWAAHQRRVN